MARYNGYRDDEFELADELMKTKPIAEVARDSRIPMSTSVLQERHKKLGLTHISIKKVVGMDPAEIAPKFASWSRAQNF